QRVVEPHPRPELERPDGVAAKDGEEEGEGADEVGRETEEEAALGERLEDEAEVVGLQVAEAAVGEPRGAAAGPLREVARLHQRDVGAAAGRVVRGGHPGDPAADDEEVVAPLPERPPVEDARRRGERSGSGLLLRRHQSLGGVTPTCPWYFPLRSA